MDAMNLHLKHVIESWERSGQRDGGHINVDFDNEALDYSEEMNDLDQANGSEEEFGSLHYCSQAALDQHKNFIFGKTYLLYLWQILDTHDLLHSFTQRLNLSTGSGNGSLVFHLLLDINMDVLKIMVHLPICQKAAAKNKKEVVVLISLV